jgi:hypothetical protein
MTIDIFGTHALTRAVNDLASDVSTFLLDRYFPMAQTEQSEEIHFDVRKGKKRIAPIVSPKVEGKVVEQLGYESRTFRPAYLKPKAQFDPDKPFRRVAGEPIGGTLSPMERRAANVRDTLEDHAEMVMRRLEVMASEILRTGQVTVSGEGFDDRVVDFLRDNSLTITLSGTDLWSDAGSDNQKVGNLETWAGLVQNLAGVTIVDVVMDPDAWAEFRQDPEVKELLDTRRGSESELELGPNSELVSRKGELGQFVIWTYNDTYIDDAGVEQNLMPSGTVIGASRQIEGTRHFGAIKDEANNFEAVDIFSKSWVEEDPGHRWVLTQSAPLVVPYRPDASFAATVL